MKKLSLLAILFCMVASVQGQDNVVKLGLSNIGLAQVNLEYERVLTSQTSALGEITFKIPLSLPDAFFDRIESAGSGNNIQFESGKLKGFTFAGEYRFYVKGDAPQGFYVAPYLKLNNNRFDVIGSYNNSNNINVDASAGLGLFTASIGGNIGYQWLIADKVTVNWNIFGLGIGRSRISGEFTVDDNGSISGFAEDVTRYLDLIPFIPNIDIDSDNTARTVSVNDSFWTPATRASISIGLYF